MDANNPIARGVLLALAAAVAFGATTPVVQRLAEGAGPAATAALLYAGAAGFAAVQRRSEAQLTRAWWPRVVGVGLTGAFLAPIALARKGELKLELDRLRREGFVRARDSLPSHPSHGHTSPSASAIGSFCSPTRNRRNRSWKRP